MPHNFDVVCVGNAKIDTFLTLHEANSHLRFLKDTNELCLKFGEKITVDKAEILVGGNAANVSIGTSRMGLKTAILAEIGKDEFAQKIINILKVENVDTSNVIQKDGQQSSFSTILNFKGERTIFTEHVKREHNLNFENIFPKWVYLTSVGEEWQDCYKKTVDFVNNNQCLLAFNPGTLQLESGYDSIKDVLSTTNLLFVNKEEAEFLLRTTPRQKDINDLTKGLQKIGPKIVVITDGRNGSFVLDEKGKLWKKDIIQAKVIEKTGAGDAYSSGFLSALIYGETIENAMNWGTRNSTSVISKIGAQAGLLYKKDLKHDK